VGPRGVTWGVPAWPWRSAPSPTPRCRARWRRKSDARSRFPAVPRRSLCPSSSTLGAKPPRAQSCVAGGLGGISAQVGSEAAAGTKLPLSPRRRCPGRRGAGAAGEGSGEAGGGAETPGPWRQGGDGRPAWRHPPSRQRLWALSGCFELFSFSPPPSKALGEFWAGGVGGEAQDPFLHRASVSPRCPAASRPLRNATSLAGSGLGGCGVSGGLFPLRGGLVPNLRVRGHPQSGYTGVGGTSVGRGAAVGQELALCCSPHPSCSPGSGGPDPAQIPPPSPDQSTGEGALLSTPLGKAERGPGGRWSRLLRPQPRPPAGSVPSPQDMGCGPAPRHL